MENRVYNAKIEKLRSKDRMQILEVDRVVNLSLEAIKVHSILDVGTGSAIFAEAFARKNLSVSGVDINEKMIEEAKKYVPTAKFTVGKAEKLPFSENNFDVVFLGHVLHESESIEQVLVEAKRVAKQRVVVLEWPYKKEEQGPPLAHRLKAQDIIETAGTVGFLTIEELSLKHMVLFRMEKIRSNSN
jgi:ubiquinone/menaquinone biosynthesis C-methylase UbiE